MYFHSLEWTDSNGWMSLKSHSWTQRAPWADEVTGLLCLCCHTFLAGLWGPFYQQEPWHPAQWHVYVKKKGPTAGGRTRDAGRSGSGFLRPRLAWAGGKWDTVAYTAHQRLELSGINTHRPVIIFHIPPARKKLICGFWAQVLQLFLWRKLVGHS